jgi:hypothetical protein
MPIDLRPYIEDHDCVEAAQAAYLADLEAAIAKGHGTARMAHALATGLQHHVERLNEAFVRGDVPRSLAADWRADAKVFVGNTGTRFWRGKLAGRSAVMIDLDLVIRLVLFTYLVGIDTDEDDVTAHALASFLLLSLVVPSDEPFPLIEELLGVAAARDGRVINDLFSIVGDFVLFHEIGHAYAMACGTRYVRVRFALPDGIEATPERIQNVQLHPDGPILNCIPSYDEVGAMLIMAPAYEHWMNEFAADIFAAYAAVLAPASGRPGAADLERFADTLACWQLPLFAMGWREQYLRRSAGDVESVRHSHPAAHGRMDVIALHFNFLGDEFAPEWRSPAMGRFLEHYQSLWASDLAQLLAEGIEYVRYAFDEEGPHLGHADRYLASGDPLPFTPSAMVKLKRHLLEDFLHDAQTLGWDQAARLNRDRHTNYVQTFRLNDRPILLELGRRLHSIPLRLTSEDRS